MVVVQKAKISEIKPLFRLNKIRFANSLFVWIKEGSRDSSLIENDTRVKATKPVVLAKAGRLDVIFFVAPFQDLPGKSTKD